MIHMFRLKGGFNTEAQLLCERINYVVRHEQSTSATGGLLVSIRAELAIIRPAELSTPSIFGSIHSLISRNQ
jgi:hypothetical protein